ncbi:hypothetical protein D3C75_1329080 [compost metagenome]
MSLQFNGIRLLEGRTDPGQEGGHIVKGNICANLLPRCLQYRFYPQQPFLADGLGKNLLE